MKESYILARNRARSLLSQIPDYLAVFYVSNQDMINYGLSDILTEWIFINNDSINNNQLENATSLENLLCYVIDIKSDELTDKEYLNKLEKRKINTKDYFSTKIKKEYLIYKENQMSNGYINDYYQAITSPYLATDKTLKTKDELYEDIYDEVLNWKRNDKKKLFEFKFFSVLPLKKKCDWFITELSIFAFNTICNDFYETTTGYTTKTPPLIFDVGGPIVSWASESPELNIVMDEPGIFSVYEVIIKEQDGTEVIAEIDRIPTSANSNNEIEKEKRVIMSEFATGKRAQAFDTNDWRIYTTIFSMLRIGTFSDGTIHTTLPELFSEINPLFKGKNHLKREYVNLLERLDKISHRTLSTTSHDEYGRAIRQSNINFFTFDYVILDKKADSTTLSISEIKKKIDFNLFTIKELEGMEITITPSSYTKKQWIDMKYKQIMSSDFKKLGESKDQVVLQILQEFRIKIYPELSCYIPYQDIESNIRTIKLRTTRLRKEIRSSIERIYEINSIIESYDFDKTGISMRFKNLTEFEKEAYNI